MGGARKLWTFSTFWGIFFILDSPLTNSNDIHENFQKVLFCKSFADYAVSCLFFLNIISVDKNLMCSNTESTKRGILGSRIPRKVLQGEE